MGEGTNVGIPFLGIAAAFAFFIYGGMAGVFGIIIYTFLVGLVAILVGLIPGIGFVFAYLINTAVVVPWVFAYTGIAASWLTTLILVIYSAISLFVSLYIFKEVWG
jgi:hypothetical protein